MGDVGVTGDVEAAAIVMLEDRLDQEADDVSTKIRREIADAQRAIRIRIVRMRLDREAMSVLLRPLPMFLQNRIRRVIRMKRKRVDKIAVDVGGARAELQSRTAVRSDRLIQLRARDGRCQGSPCIGIIRLKGDGPVKRGDSVIEQSRSRERTAHVGQRHSVGGRKAMELRKLLMA